MKHINVVTFVYHFWSNWNLKMVVFETGKLGHLKINLLDQSWEPTKNLTHMWCQCQDLNPGHHGRMQALLPLHHPCSNIIHLTTDNSNIQGK